MCVRDAIDVKHADGLESWLADMVFPDFKQLVELWSGKVKTSLSKGVGKTSGKRKKAIN